jgi:hypothetical protein
MSDARVASLEAHVEHIRDDIARIKGDVSALRDGVYDLKVNAATLNERVAGLPTKGFIVTAVMVALAIVTAVTLFQSQIRDLAGIPSTPALTRQQ